MAEEIAHMHAGLATAPPGRRERALALSVVVVSALVLVLVTPFARTPLGELKPFIPAYQAALLINDLITAVLLFAQFVRLQSRAMLILACGYLFDALIIVPHTMSFPGLFAPQGLLGAGPQTTAWLYAFWHGGFAVFVLAYAVLSRPRFGPQMVRMPASYAIVLSSGAVLVTVAALAALATAGHDYLPVIMRGNNYELMVWKGVSPAICALSILAIVALWPRRNASVLDLWLIVVLCVWICDVALSAVVGSSRYDLGFYAGRAYGLLSASFLLIILLIEVMKLQAELLRSREALARVQRFEAIGRLTGAVAHDFNNLLTAAIGNLEMLDRAPDLTARGRAHVKAALRALDRGGRITSQLLAFGRRQALRPERIDVSSWLREFEALLRRAAGEKVNFRLDIAGSGLFTSIDLSQFETTVLNLVLNARDAMPNGGELVIAAKLQRLEAQDFVSDEEIVPGNYVALTFADTGVGMTPEVRNRAFEPFYTTKDVAPGSGLGLSQVYGFVKQSDGHVTVDSVENGGTKVALYLPPA